MKKKITLFLAMLLVFMPVSASSLSDKKNQLSNTEQNIKDKEAQIAEKQEEKSAIEEEIKAVDLEIVDIQNNIKELGEQLEEKKEQIEESQQKLDLANTKKEEQYDATKARMVQMYKNQKIGYMQVLFSSNSFWDAINRMEYVRRISQKDNTILDDYKAQIEEIEVQKKTIESEKNKLDLLQKEAYAKNEELESVRSKKETAMNALAEEEGKLKSEIESLEQVSKDLKAEINELTKQLAAQSGSNAPTQYVGGALMWPVPGHYRISSDYVGRVSPIFGTAEFHTGIDIPAGYGEDVVAAADGVVITSGWVRGYGNTIMISHGSGIVTLYGHNSSLVVSNGQSVKRGQVIAKIGSTGYATGNHCHFEVRVNGDHTSPWPYLNN